MEKQRKVDINQFENDEGKKVCLLAGEDGTEKKDYVYVVDCCPYLKVCHGDIQYSVKDEEEFCYIPSETFFCPVDGEELDQDEMGYPLCSERCLKESK